MGALGAIAAVAVMLLVSPRSAVAGDHRPETPAQIARRLLDQMPTEGVRARVAREAIERWRDNVGRRAEWLGTGNSYKGLGTGASDGTRVEVVLLDDGVVSRPGSNYTLAILRAGGRVVDWRVCITDNGLGGELQRLMLEDVDGDGALDVAFRGDPERGRSDRLHRREGDHARAWIKAFRITGRGLQSIFPPPRELTMKTVTDARGRPFRLSITAPARVRSYEAFAWSVTITNTSKEARPLPEGDLELDGYGRLWAREGEQRVLQPGASVTMRWLAAIHAGEGRSDATLFYRLKSR